ncbi:MAG: bifunctional serine/threonine-protein kinase/formylglycine-generating enzyme family protein, partial [Myxococcota bacterium]
HCYANIEDRSLNVCPECEEPCRRGGGWPEDRWLGEVVDGGKYRVERLLGSGGFSNVYRVRHTALEERVFAMKVLNQAAMDNPQCEDLFINESKLLLGFDHPHIVKFHEVGWLEHGPAFALMELLIGKDLHKVLSEEQGPLPAERVARIGAQIASALEAAHERGVLHRDLKPENVLLLSNDEVRVIDFGIAKVLGVGASGGQLSQFIGTPIYMAPEQFDVGSEIDGRLDIYQLGGVLFTLLTCETPYDPRGPDGTLAGVLDIARQQDARADQIGPRPSERIPNLALYAPTLDTLIGEMLSTKPDMRPLSATEVRERLEASLEHIHDAPPSTPRAHTSSPAHDRPTRAFSNHPMPPTPPAEPASAMPGKLGPVDTAFESIPAPLPPPVPSPTPGGDSNPLRLLQERFQAELSTAEGRQRVLYVGLGAIAVLSVLVVTLLLISDRDDNNPLEGTATAIPSTRPSNTNTVGRFVMLEAGLAVLGSPRAEQGREQDEQLTQVPLSYAFTMQAHEVTQDQWKTVMETNPSWFSSCGPDCPVEQVSWFDALSYANALSEKEGLVPCYRLAACDGEPHGGCPTEEPWCQGNHICQNVTFKGVQCEGYRLPTEAEWEYAARAESRKPRYGELDKIGWTWGNSDGTTHPVCQAEPNAWGLCDMIGNVAEWTWDRYGNYPRDDTPDYTGPTEGRFRTTRGCSWNNFTRDCRVAQRHRRDPAERDRVLGFRVVRTLPNDKAAPSAPSDDETSP